MALDQSALSELLDALRAGGDLDVVREGLALVLQALIESEAAEVIGAGRYERSAARTTHRNGNRARLLSTKAGDVELRIPKLREGSFFPALLEPRRRIDRALLAVVMEAYVHGTSTRKVDDLVKALGVDSGISKSEVSRICKSLDTEVRSFLARPIEAECPYVWLDATFHKVRETGRVISVATVVAIGVTTTGERTVLGAQTGPSEDHQFWVAFLRQLVKRGLTGVRLVISDAHEGLRQAIAKVLHGATWQRCRVHFMRNLLSVVPKQAQDTVAAIVRTVFSQPDHASAMTQLHDVARMLSERFPQAAELLEDAAEDVLAHLHFPREHRRRLHSTNPLERLHKEIKRRTRVVGIFPSRDSLMRMVGTLLAEQDDEWQVADRRYFSLGSMTKVDEIEGGEDSKELLAQIA
jgi:transposase-like protein